MQFKIRMVVNPGDETISKGAVTLVDASGVENPEQMILEGETVECSVDLKAGQKLVVREMERPVVHDTTTMAATKVDLTPPKEPPTEPTPKLTPAAGHQSASHKK